MSRDQFWALVQRHNQLGRLLPTGDDLLDDAALLEAKIVLDEMALCKQEIDDLLAAEAAKGKP
jgi:hypothetical protein